VLSVNSPWTTAAYGGASVVALGIAACMWGIPLPLTDFTVFLLELEPLSLWDVIVSRLQTTGNFRPLYFAQMKILLETSEAANGRYFEVFKLFYAAQWVATVLLLVRLMRVRTAVDWAAASVALMVLIGMHTIINVLREGPLTIVFCCALALNLSFAERRSAWRDTAGVLLLIFSAMAVELGLLVWVCYIAAYLVGCRGLSRTSLTLCTALVVAYLALRFVVLDPGGGGLNFRETGFGMTTKSVEEIMRLVGGRRVVLYAYNVAASVLTVLFSEPRQGVFLFVNSLMTDEWRAWLWVNVIASVFSSGFLLWLAIRRLPAWQRYTLTHEDRLVMVFVAVLLANATISFAYTRDVIMSPAGLLYALAVYAAVREMLMRYPAMRPPFRLLVTAALLILSVAWTMRAVGTTYVLRDTAFDKRNDWGTGIERLEERGQMPVDERRRAFVRHLRRDALEMPTPAPGLAQPWAEEWADQVY
jgi:hypothetical protein